MRTSHIDVCAFIKIWAFVYFCPEIVTAEKYHQGCVRFSINSKMLLYVNIQTEYIYYIWISVPKISVPGCIKQRLGKKIYV